MEYFHVKVTVRSATNNIEFEFDLSVTDLHQRFLDPYSKGDAVVVNGRTVKMDDLEQIRISASDINSDTINSQLRWGQEQRRSYSPINVATGRLADSLLFERATDVTRQFITGPPGNEPHQQAGNQTISPVAVNLEEVFVVHGRNKAARDAMFNFLRTIGLTPLEWNIAVQATGKPAPYVGEVLDAAFGRAQGIVVLLTPDDVVMLHSTLRSPQDPEFEKEPTGQARPNVLFEAGMAMGRSEGRTVLVELGNLRPFSDIGGRHTIRLDNSSQRRQELAQRLQIAGCPAKLTGTDWHTAGDFEGAVAEENDNFGHLVEQPPELPTTPPISADARELLLEAARSADDTIMAYKVMAGLGIRTGNRSFVEPGDRRSEARWKRALEELEQNGLIEELSYKREAFQLTHVGFAMADTLDVRQKGIQTESP